MELGNIVLDENKMACLLKNDALSERSSQEMRQGGPLPIKPIVTELLSLIHTSAWHVDKEWRVMNGLEGKNRILEQIDDSHMKVDYNAMKLKNDNARILMERINDIISNEVVVGYKLIQLKYLIDNRIATEYNQYINLDEKIGTHHPNLKQLEAINKKTNIKFRKVLQILQEGIQGKIEKITAEFMNNRKVTDRIKDYLEQYTPQKILKVYNTNVIYKSFRRKAGMNKEQQGYLEEYVNKLRKEVKKNQTERDLDIFNALELDAEYYKENLPKAMEPIDDLFDSIDTFDFTPVQEEED